MLRLDVEDDDAVLRSLTEVADEALTELNVLADDTEVRLDSDCVVAVDLVVGDDPVDLLLVDSVLSVDADDTEDLEDNVIDPVIVDALLDELGVDAVDMLDGVTKDAVVALDGVTADTDDALEGVETDCVDKLDGIDNED